MRWGTFSKGWISWFKLIRRKKSWRTYPGAQSVSCVWLFATQWTAARQVPLSMEFSRQEYWSGLSFPTPGDFPKPEIRPMSLVSPTPAGRSLTTDPPGTPMTLHNSPIVSRFWSSDSKFIYLQLMNIEITFHIILRLFLGMCGVPKPLIHFFSSVWVILKSWVLLKTYSESRRTLLW